MRGFFFLPPPGWLHNQAAKPPDRVDFPKRCVQSKARHEKGAIRQCVTLFLLLRVPVELGICRDFFAWQKPSKTPEDTLTAAHCHRASTKANRIPILNPSPAMCGAFSIDTPPVG